MSPAHPAYGPAHPHSSFAGVRDSCAPVASAAGAPMAPDLGVMKFDNHGAQLVPRLGGRGARHGSGGRRWGRGRKERMDLLRRRVHSDSSGPVRYRRCPFARPPPPPPHPICRHRHRHRPRALRLRCHDWPCPRHEVRIRYDRHALHEPLPLDAFRLDPGRLDPGMRRAVGAG